MQREKATGTTVHSCGHTPQQTGYCQAEARQTTKPLSERKTNSQQVQRERVRNNGEIAGVEESHVHFH